VKAHSSYFKKLKKKYLSYRLGEVMLWASSAAMLVMGILFFAKVDPRLPGPAFIVIHVGVFIWGFRRFRLHNLSEKRFVKYINDNHPDLEQSVDLLIKDDSSLTSLQLLQKQRTIEKFERKSISNNSASAEILARICAFPFLCNSFGRIDLLRTA
jgi:hypothetical protein